MFLLQILFPILLARAIYVDILIGLDGDDDNNDDDDNDNDDVSSKSSKEK